MISRKSMMAVGLAVESRTYAQILVEDYGASEVWPLVDIASGTMIRAYVNANRNGTLSGWDLQNTTGPVGGNLAPFSDGINDYGNILTSNGSTGLVDIFDGTEGSLVGWAKVASSSVWLDGTLDVLAHLGRNGLNRIIIYKDTQNNNVWFEYTAAGVLRSVDFAPFNSASWFSYGMSWSSGADEVRCYLNGAQVGPTLTGLGAWSGALTTGAIGSVLGTSASLPWNGWLGHLAVRFGEVWTPSNMEDIYNAINPLAASGFTQWYVAP